jgi:hypothetical protein
MLNVNPDPPVAVTVILPSDAEDELGGVAFPVTVTVTEAQGFGVTGSDPPLLLQAFIKKTIIIIPRVRR